MIAAGGAPGERLAQHGQSVELTHVLGPDGAWTSIESRANEEAECGSEY
jgi:hypothetical protein